MTLERIVRNSQQCAQNGRTRRCALHVQRNTHTHPTDLADTPNVSECHQTARIHRGCWITVPCSMEWVSSPDANTMGTFSHEYRVADLDMLVLTNTQRNTSISFLHQRQRKTQCKQWQNQPLHEKDHAILGIIVRSKQRNASQRLCGFHQHTQKPSAEEVNVNH